MKKRLSCLLHYNNNISIFHHITVDEKRCFEAASVVTATSNYRSSAESTLSHPYHCIHGASNYRSYLKTLQPHPSQCIINNNI